MKILHRDDIEQSGFADVREHQLIKDMRIFGEAKSRNMWGCIGNFVYISDAKFLPKGETKLHSHKEIDVISIMIEGRTAHEGSLEHGQELKTNDIQVQRAGGEGFSHNEINPDDAENRMIQIWVLPEQSGQAANYKHYSLNTSGLMRVYGGGSNQNETLDSHTLIDVGIIKADERISLNSPMLAYITRGAGILNGQPVKNGDLIHDEKLAFHANQDTQLIIIHLMQ